MKKTPSFYADILELIDATAMAAKLHGSDSIPLSEIEELKKEIIKKDADRRAQCGKRDKSLKPDKPPLLDAIDYLNENGCSFYFLKAQAENYQYWRKDRHLETYSLGAVQNHLKRAAQELEINPPWIQQKNKNPKKKAI